MNPKVTIIMATYNRAHFIVETLHSIQQQTFTDWECIIIDDGGTDNTKEVLTPILEQDNRFQFLKRPNTYLKGLPGCRNYGLDLAKGDSIIFFDDDDIIHPDNLKISLSVIENEQVAFCHYQKKAFEKNIPEFSFKEPKIQQKLNVAFLYDVITHQIGLASCTVLWHKKCFATIRFREELLYAEEWECYSRILSEGFEGIIIENVLYFNRKHPNSNTAEFYSDNPIRKKSNNDAILLVIANMEEKQLLTSKILRHFIQIALDYKEYKLFSAILETSKLSFIGKLKWYLFYTFLPVRLYLYSLKKKMLS
ncbi:MULTISPECIES: glycosyltransferase family 2 protein [unclassified Flavobacterium]|uniref:glycosyltransferase family 2 protein n=1 Tax=unclassified Flavobacterium TaxID=196869 RepID=UPI0012929626|nr:MULTISPECIES: glycosyltransferase family 2 protein [unclassified Flavobacterium]MQP52025.1 glycosyltransferase [Flavobacterium sp. LMO9]MQP61894.1 glycosyltransferase [Flavobacterium sp. LMO6]